LKKEIIKPFQINQTLVNKPKLFFIQACRGDTVMPNIERLDISHDLIRQTSNIQTDAIKLPIGADFLYSYATVEGYKAFRNTNTGSWYIQILCDVSSKAASEEFSHLLLEVNDRMANKEIVISSFECQLRKKLYLAKITNKSKKVYDTGRYEGEMKGDKANGHGAFYFSNGNRYEGNWRDDNKNGHGICYFKNGDRYEGNWRDDKANGQGIYYFNNGNRYEGNCKDDKANGHGTFYYNNGDRYEGNWKDDKMHGQGILYFKNGTQISGVWLNGNRIK
jgi:hypothetical protein